MRIDWTQTMIGASACAERAQATRSGLAGDSAVVPFAQTRLAGILAVCGLFGLSIVSMPWRGSATTLPEILALSGFLLAHVAGLVGAARLGWLAGAGAMVPALAFPLFAGVPAQGLATLLMLIVLDIVALHGAETRNRRQVLAAVLAAALLALAYPLFGRAGSAGTMLVLAALVPVLVTAFATRRRSVGDDAVAAGREIARLTALFHASADEGARALRVTDGVGRIDTETGAQPGHDALFPEGSVVTATLIADRVHLLDALSRAIHRRERTENLLLRLRREPVGAGYPTPPRYEAMRCAVYPVPGIPDRAVVALDLAGEAGAAMPPATAMPDAALLARALHDGTAPFNAGLGYLEMIADPRLAPQDRTAWRDYAAEAHKAITEAHRNTLLLGRWMQRLRMPEAPVDAVEIAPARLVQEAIRGLHLREALDRGEIRLVEEEPLPMVMVPLATARFAVEVLLRFAQGEPRSEVRLARQGRDLVLACRVLGEAAADTPADAGGIDAFQHLLEAAASAGNLHFDGEESGRERRLSLTDAFPVKPVLAAGKTGPSDPEYPVRLAS
jgi:hypothetical protein